MFAAITPTTSITSPTTTTTTTTTSSTTAPTKNTTTDTSTTTTTTTKTGALSNSLLKLKQIKNGLKLNGHQLRFYGGRFYLGLRVNPLTTGI